jgi:F-type H+-transporting ATPase subunit delta
MADLQAAKRYAQAAFDIAVEANAVAQWRVDLDEIAQVLAESAAAPVFADGRIPLERRIAMVERALALQPLALNLARLLVSKSRSGEARAVANAFNRIADAHEGIVHAVVTTAVELSPGQLQGIERRMSTTLGKSVQATSIVDPSVIGGVVVKVGDRLVDGSVRTRLKRLRRELEGAR